MSEAGASDQFNYFFAFYGLILGLAVAELLGALAAVVRAGSLRKIELRTALTAVFIFVAISTTWIDAWGNRSAATIDLQWLWAPVVIATCYYLAANIVIPKERPDFADLGAYFEARRKVLFGLLLAADLLVSYTTREFFAKALVEAPETFWFFDLPYNLLLKGMLLSLILVRNRRLTIGLLLALIALLILPYWWIENPIAAVIVNSFS